MTSATPRTAVVTVSFGSEAVLKPMIRSLGIALSEPYRLVVVDNKPVENSPVQALTLAAGGHYLELASNPGYGSAINTAVAWLDDDIEWIVIANPDLEFHAASIDRMLAVARSSDDVGTVGPAILNDDGTIYPSARTIPSLRTGIGHALFGQIWPGNPWSRRYKLDDPSRAVARDAGWLSGACLVMRRRLFAELGGFDDQYFMYFEDVDLGYRVGKAGYRNVYEPSAKVGHLQGHSTGSGTTSVAMIQAHHASARRFIVKKYRGPALLPVRFGLSLGLRLRSRLLTARAHGDGGSAQATPDSTS